MNSVTEQALWDLVTTRFHGVLRPGSHREDHDACALELLSVCQEQRWTDNPTTLRTFDLRPLNDMAIGDSLRTQYLIPLLAQYAYSLDWTVEKQQKVLTQLILSTVNRLIAELPHLPPAIAHQCRDAKTLKEAEQAATAAAGAATTDAATAAAWAATDAATDVAWAATDAATRHIFITTCQVWLEATHVA